MTKRIYTDEQKQRKKETNKQWVFEHREQERVKGAERASASRARGRQIVLDAYGGKCACCGESDRRFLCLDHVNNDGYLERHATGIRQSGSSAYYKIIRAGFPSTYQLLCYNCNCGRAYNSHNPGVCPHKDPL